MLSPTKFRIVNRICELQLRLTSRYVGEGGEGANVPQKAEGGEGANVPQKAEGGEGANVPQKAEGGEGANVPQKANAPQRAVWREPAPVNRKWDIIPGHGISVDTMVMMQQRVDFSPEAIVKWAEDRKRKSMIAHQSNVRDRRIMCGYEVGAAHFVLELNGAIRFKNHSRWLNDDKTKTKNKKILPMLPIRGTCLEAVDLSGTRILYEGLDNLIGLRGLKSLNFKACPSIDDWCLDKISSNFREHLTHLDISECPLITEKGLAVLPRLKNLKSLHLHNLSGVKFGQLVCMMLEDAMPQCKIYGIDYMKDLKAKEEEDEDAVVVDGQMLNENSKLSISPLTTTQVVKEN